MKPLSAVASSAFLIFYGLVAVGWITVTPAHVGRGALIAAVIVLADSFVLGTRPLRRSPQ
jgi:hypothetical protein